MRRSARAFKEYADGKIWLQDDCESWTRDRTRAALFTPSEQTLLGDVELGNTPISFEEISEDEYMRFIHAPSLFKEP